MAKKETTQRPQRLKQQTIPGSDSPSVPEINAAAEEYVDRRDMRMSLGREETEAAQKLEALMRQYNFTFYEYEGNVVTLDSVTKVKVKRKKTPGDNGEDE